MVKYYGIRHLGPGSALSLSKALKAQEPDLILVEGPADAQDCLETIADQGLKPPVAIIIYDAKKVHRSVYMPFAEYSPEWVALNYGVKQGVPCTLMDLPQGYHFKMDETQHRGFQGFLFQNKQYEMPSRPVHIDPLGAMAQLAGYEDVERWWEVTFEHQEDPQLVFTEIARLIDGLRQMDMEISVEEQFREAYMRATIRASIKKGYKNIAVVCGAWHLPALQLAETADDKEDTAIIKSVSPIKTKATWIPWSYDRLVNSGYGAGVQSPEWYHLIYKKKQQASLHWMVRAGQILRREGFDIAPASTIEAVRLADSLAAMRQLRIAGLQELMEAAQTVLCQGAIAPLKIVEEELVVGRRRGKVPEHTILTPLESDFIARVKSARLTKAYKSEEAVSKSLDLRKPSNLIGSQLLHQLQILRIPWGKLKKGPRFQLGSFAEHWRLHWRGEYQIRIIESGMWGKTIESAATNCGYEVLNEITELNQFAELLDVSMKAQLEQLTWDVINALEQRVTDQHNVLELIHLLPSLIQMTKYGSIRPTQLGPIHSLIRHVMPRVLAMLPVQLSGLGHEAARRYFEQLKDFHQSVLILAQEDLTVAWYQCLNRLNAVSDLPFLLQGLVVRLLSDRKEMLPTETSMRLSFALSAEQDPQDSALWLEGLMFPDAAILIYHHSFRKLINEWLLSLSKSRFEIVLPTLRKSFAETTAPMKQVLLEATDSYQTAEIVSGEWVHALNLPSIRMILGVNDTILKNNK